MCCIDHIINICLRMHIFIALSLLLQVNLRTAVPSKLSFSFCLVVFLNRILCRNVFR